MRLNEYLPPYTGEAYTGEAYTRKPFSMYYQLNSIMYLT